MLNLIFKDAVNVLEAQIFQRREGEAVFRIVKGANYTDNDEAFLRNESELRFGNRLKIEFDYVSRLTRTNSGKLRFVVNELVAGQIE